MKVKWLLTWSAVLFTVACSDVPDAQAKYTLCDCVIHPPNTDAKLAACSRLIDSMDQGEMIRQTMACKNEVPVPEGGPDICYCMHGESEDPDVRGQCQALFEEIEHSDLIAITRRCAAERVRNQ